MQNQRLGPYELQQVIGRGGMGTVYRATDSKSGDVVAVKALAPVYSFDEHFRARFESEIATLIGLDHPNIVRIISYGQEDGNLFFAMELVAGNSLFQRQKLGHTFLWHEVLEIARQVASGLRHAHERGVIHRDLKPGNILVDEHENLKITDFGIAKTFGGRQMTGVGNIVGTMDFMAPEQALGKPATTKSDLYSLGIVLYTLLSGRPPLTAGSVEETFENLKRHNVPRIEKVVDGLPRPVAELIHSLLEKNPDDRIPTALALKKRVEALLDELKFYSEAKTHVVDGSVPIPTSKPSGTPNVTVKTASRENNPIADSERTRLSAKQIDPAKAPSAPSEKPKGRASLAEPTRISQKRPAAPSDKAGVEPNSNDPTLTNKDKNAESSTPVIQPDYFSPVTDHVRKRQSDDGKVDAPRGRIWPVAISFVAVLGLLSFGVYAAVIRKPGADRLLQTIDAETERLTRVREEIDNFVAYYPDHERANEIGDLKKIVEATIYTNTLVKKNRTRLSNLQMEYLDIINSTRTDENERAEKLESFVSLRGSLSELSDADDECLMHARGFILKIAFDKAAFHNHELKLIRDAIERATDLKNSNPREGIRILESVISLHSDYDGVRNELKEAQQLVDELYRVLEQKPERDESKN